MILIIKYLIFILLLVHICIVLNVYVIVVVNNYFAIFAFLEKSLNRLIFRLSSGLPVWTRRLMGFLFFLIFLNWREKTLGWIYRSSKLCIGQIFIIYLWTKLIFLLFIYCILWQALLFLKYLRLVLRNLLRVKIMIQRGASSSHCPSPLSLPLCRWASLRSQSLHSGKPILEVCSHPEARGVRQAWGASAVKWLMK